MRTTVETIEETRARIREIVSSRGPVGRWVAAHLEYPESDWCLIFPFAWEAGHYPKYTLYRPGSRRNFQVHRLMCEHRHGPPPSAEHHAAHNCGRGLQGCVNPLHVEWKTASQNQLDRGGGRPKWKLTPEAAEQIRAAGKTEMPGDIARKFGVTVRNVRMILSGQAWSSNQPKIFTEDEVREIRKRFGTVPAPVLAEEFGCHRAAIGLIGRGRSYRWVK